MSIYELYQELIIDHGRRPRNFAVTEGANFIKEGFNPLCGDKITLYLKEKNGVIQSATFQGSGCAISIASASLMTEAIKGKTLEQVEKLFNQFHNLLLGKEQIAENLGKLAVLSGVAAYPMRVKCATLAWHTLMGAIKKEKDYEHFVN